VHIMWHMKKIPTAHEVGNVEEGDYLGDLSLNWSIILKCFSEK